MRTLILTAALLAPSWAWAQQPIELKFDALAAKAKGKAEIDLDENALAQGKQVLGGKSNLPAGVTAFHLRHYEFEMPGAYSAGDLEPVRKQVASGWSRILSVKEKDETVEMFLRSGSPTGFVLIAAEPKELTVIYVTGTLELAQLKELVSSKIDYDLKKDAKE